MLCKISPRERFELVEKWMPFLTSLTPSGTAMPAPGIGKRNSPSGMNCRIEELTYFRSEHRADETETPWMIPNPIAMCHKNFLSVDFFHYTSIYHPHSKLIWNIVENPNVMVANEPCYLDAEIRELSEFSKKAHKTPWNHKAIFIPIVEDIT